jgi:Sec-independent protein translocase protein TatA
MNIFGIGPLEIIFVLIIGILVLGPEGMVEAGRKLGKFLRSIIKSSWWQNIRHGVKEIQYLPQRLMREAELEELKELRKITQDDFPRIGGSDPLQSSSWSGNQPPPNPSKTIPSDPETQEQPLSPPSENSSAES